MVNSVERGIPGDLVEANSGALCPATFDQAPAKS